MEIEYLQTSQETPSSTARTTGGRGERERERERERKLDFELVCMMDFLIRFLKAFCTMDVVENEAGQSRANPAAFPSELTWL